MPRWGIPYREEPLDLDAVFGRAAPRVLDIGFGDGEALLTAAAMSCGGDDAAVPDSGQGGSASATTTSTTTGSR